MATNSTQPGPAVLNPSMAETTRDDAIILATYAVAIAVAVATASMVWGDVARWAAILVADLCATVVVFVVSRALNNSSVYDAYWSVAPPVVALGLLLAGNPGAPARAWLVAGLVTTWGVRLTYNWWRGWRGMSHEDWRYVDLRASMGRAYWFISFLGLHLFPTALVYVGCLSLLPVMDPNATSVGPLDLLATVVTAGAILIEATADRQLHAFVVSEPGPDAVLTQGLRGRCRHPNYLGEVSFWCGLALFGIAAVPSAWWVVAGPAVMASLFVFVSVPLLEKRMLRKRPAYAEVVQRYPMLLPLGRRP